MPQRPSGTFRKTIAFSLVFFALLVGAGIVIGERLRAHSEHLAKLRADVVAAEARYNDERRARERVNMAYNRFTSALDSFYRSNSASFLADEVVNLQDTLTALQGARSDLQSAFDQYKKTGMALDYTRIALHSEDVVIETQREALTISNSEMSNPVASASAAEMFSGQNGSMQQSAEAVGKNLAMARNSELAAMESYERRLDLALHAARGSQDGVETQMLFDSVMSP